MFYMRCQQSRIETGPKWMTRCWPACSASTSSGRARRRKPLSYSLAPPPALLRPRITARQAVSTVRFNGHAEHHVRQRSHMWRRSSWESVYFTGSCIEGHTAQQGRSAFHSQLADSPAKTKRAARADRPFAWLKAEISASRTRPPGWVPSAPDRALHPAWARG